MKMIQLLKTAYAFDDEQDEQLIAILKVSEQLKIAYIRNSYDFQEIKNFVKKKATL